MYVYFDGHHKRVKGYCTLTASTYHPLLKKQVPLAILECKHVDTKNIEVLWRLFNKAYQNEFPDEKFNPLGLTDNAPAGKNIWGRRFGKGERM